MKYSLRAWSLFCTVAVPHLASTSHGDQFDPSSYESVDVLTRDIAVIGGGASGTYGAIRLEDLGKSVVVVEKASTLGGHVHTYTVPNTNTKIDYGVIAYWNTSIAADFFSRFNVTVKGFSPGASTTVYSDFTTGQALANFTVNSNWSAYTAQLDKYPYLAESWQLPNPVPNDLLLPFGEFVEKYSLQDVAYSLYSASAAGGMGTILNQLTANVMKAIGQVYMLEVQQRQVVTTSNNHELYDKALDYLGSSVLLDSVVIAAERLAGENKTGIKLVVQTPTGRKLILASQLLVSVPLQLDNMSPFGLDQREFNVFKEFNNTAYYSGLVAQTGLPAAVNYINAGSDTLYNIPNFPGLYHISSTAVEGIFSFWYGADRGLPEDQIKKDISAAIQRLSGSASTTPEFVAFANNTPFNLNVPAEVIESGFYDDLNQLQGYRNTWYTGGVFTPSSGALWVFTENLVSQIVAAM